MNSPTRNGKIARLPHDVREQFNDRIFNGGCGRTLLAWINELAEVRAVLVAEFGGRPVNAPNLTAWRQGGYREWLMQRETQALAESLGRNRAGEHRGFAEALTLSLAGRYTVALDRLRAAASPEEHQRWLREMCHDVVQLSRATGAGGRLGGYGRRAKWRPSSPVKSI